MAASWRSLCRGSSLTIEDGGVRVALSEGRAHRLVVEENDDAFVLSAVILRRAAVEQAHVHAVRIWEMNRSLNLVGLRIDDKGRLVGEAWVPKLGVTPEEFRTIAHNLAVECDRYEFMLTGRDCE